MSLLTIYYAPRSGLENLETLILGKKEKLLTEIYNVVLNYEKIICDC